MESLDTGGNPSIEEDVKRHFSLHRGDFASGVDPRIRQSVR
jgi:hypothetical protein